MRKSIAFAAVLGLLLPIAALAAGSGGAHGGSGHGGGGHGGNGHGGGYHGHGYRGGVGFYFGVPYYGWPYPPYGYYDPYGYYGPDDADYPGTDAPPPGPPPDEGQAAVPAQPMWYYCAPSKGYYPYVQNCAAPWQAVPATPPPAQP